LPITGYYQFTGLQGRPVVRCLDPEATFASLSPLSVLSLPPCASLFSHSTFAVPKRNPRVPAVLVLVESPVQIRTRHLRCSWSKSLLQFLRFHFAGSSGENLLQVLGFPFLEPKELNLCLFSVLI